MKSFLRVITTFVVALVFGLALTSCSEYNFYEEFVNAGADIEKDHIFEVLTLSEVEAKIEADETFVLVYGTAESSSCVNIVSSLQAQYEYLQVEDTLEDGKEVTIYFMDATDYIDSSKKRKEIREALNIKEPMDSTSDSPVIVIYKNAPALKPFREKNAARIKKLGESIKKFFNGLFAKKNKVTKEDK